MEKEIRLWVDPGICGFKCDIEVKRVSKERVEIRINGTGCKHIQKLGESIPSLTLRDLFSPIIQNPVYLSAQRARCHPSCVIPVAIIKAAEIALETALPRDVSIKVDERP